MQMSLPAGKASWFLQGIIATQFCAGKVLCFWVPWCSLDWASRRKLQMLYLQQKLLAVLSRLL